MILLDVIAAVWFFVFGSVIGSFMNVVVHRTPRGESIVGSSRCPRCGAAIRWHDNLPVFGWFMLRGRCRDCSLPISFRYPVVEFVTGCIFLLLAIAELFSGGANLPAPWTPLRFSGFGHLLAGLEETPNAALLRIYILHVILLSTLFCWALMRVDKAAVPQWQMFLMWTFGFAFVSVWPNTQPLPWTGAAIEAQAGVWQHLDGFRGAAIGFFIAGVVALLWMALRGRRGNKDQNAAFSASLTAIGVMLGWQAMLSILILTALSRGVMTISAWRSPRLRSVPLLMDLMVATVVQICFWKNLWELRTRIGADGLALQLGGTAIALFVLVASEWSRDCLDQSPGSSELTDASPDQLPQEERPAGEAEEKHADKDGDFIERDMAE